VISEETSGFLHFHTPAIRLYIHRPRAMDKLLDGTSRYPLSFG
jgi:hypothetical protein